jgi:hypothetical protein
MVKNVNRRCIVGMTSVEFVHCERIGKMCYRIMGECAREMTRNDHITDKPLWAHAILFAAKNKKDKNVDTFVFFVVH